MQTPIRTPTQGRTLSDHAQITSMYNDVMSIAFFMDPCSRQVAQNRLKIEKTLAELSDRLHKETDEDFIQLTQKKIDSARYQLQELTEEFDGCHVGDIHSRVNQLMSYFDGPRLCPNLS